MQDLALEVELLVDLSNMAMTRVSGSNYSNSIISNIFHYSNLDYFVQNNRIFRLFRFYENRRFLWSKIAIFGTFGIISIKFFVKLIVIRQKRAFRLSTLIRYFII